MGTRARRQALVWGGLLILFGAVSLVEVFVDLGAWLWVGILALAGLGICAVYLTDRADWGLLIPAYVMWAVALMVALITLNILWDEFVATYVLAAIALPFLVVYLRNRSQWWALIPTYALAAIGVMVALIDLGFLDDLLVPAYVMFAIAIPFFYVYMRNRALWWALIPAGIMSVIGISFLIAENMFQYVGAIALVAAGIWILVRQFRSREEAVGEPSAVEEPALSVESPTVGESPAGEGPPPE